MKCLNKIKYFKFKKKHIKRIFLILEPGIALLLFKEFRTYYLLPLIVFIFSFILFLNFPIIVVFTTNKPTYYQDLFINNKINNISHTIPIYIQNKIDYIFKWSLIISSSILLSLLSVYWIQEYSDNTTILSIIGSTGGILKIYQIINKLLASLLIFIIKKFLEKKIKIYKQNFKDKLEINSILNIEFKQLSKNCKSSYDILNNIKYNKNKKYINIV